MEILTICEECKYYEKTHNNAWTTYFMLALKHSTSNLVLLNLERLLGQSQEVEMKTNTGGSIISHLW